MHLIQYRVRNFRSVSDSGPIDVRKQTAIVGRNESGKSNLLMALKSLNPPEGVKALSKIKDFPKDRRMAEFHDDLNVVESHWELSAEERAELGRRWPRAKDVTRVEIRRGYAATRSIHFPPIGHLAFDHGVIPRAVAQLAEAQPRLLGVNAHLGDALTDLVAALTPSESLEHPAGAHAWASAALEGITRFRKQLGQHRITLEPYTAKIVDELAHSAGIVAGDAAQSEDAKSYLYGRLPLLLYLPDYPELEGHVDLDQLIQRMDSEKLRVSDENFLKLMKVAGLDVRELARLLPKNHELRQHLVNRGGAVVTKALRRLWTDRALKVRFNLDANHFDILISDPTSTYDVEVNLDERSRGFRWFFSFYVTFAADTEGGPAENAMLLLDEPGLHLHAIAQKDLLGHFARDFANQIVYTTHSPFMVPVDDMGSVRSVEISEEKGTIVHNDAGPILDPATAERVARLVRFA